ncbi:uncharacterized protein LOC128260238 [Drosophila gunungcola]|uniref:Uncharacterized protein n=1 Tax=Drosophila gunungcola TaxID=103775 RepID=A0A9P9YEX5_9MUSC|nr:uncharacterized protein LOC128260238 [Drosophila gunungcola]KAI8035665.1 hypothetical protein M5D96_011578 [Drosophila gunungcola]
MSKSQSEISGLKLKGCQQKGRLPKKPADGDNQNGDADLSLCGKPSFLVCNGKKSPDLTEVDSSTGLGHAHSSALQQTALKVQEIVKHQQHIIKIVDSVNESFAGQKDSRGKDDVES